MLKVATIIFLLIITPLHIQSRAVNLEGENNAIDDISLLDSQKSIPIDQEVWDIIDVPESSSSVSSSSSSASPLSDDESQTNSNGIVQLEKMVKITFAGRKNFRVRRNCRCVIHGRCAKTEMCG